MDPSLPTTTKITRGGAAAARVAHNHEVTGSSPVPGTKIRHPRKWVFYFGFEILGLNRLATGCLISNVASKRSIEKTPGFIFEGISRESGLNDEGELEDEYLYAILRKDWLRLYDKSRVKVIV